MQTQQPFQQDQRLRELEMKNKKLEKENKELKQELEEEEAKNKRQQQEARKLQFKLEAELKECHSKCSELEEDYQDFETSKNRDITRLKRENERLKTQFLSKSKEWEEKDQELEEQTKRLSTLQQSQNAEVSFITMMQEEEKKVKSSLKIKEQKIKELEEINKNLSEEIKKITKNERKFEQITSEKSKLANLQSQQEEACKEYQAKIKIIQEENKQYLASIKNLQILKSKLEEQLSEYRRNIQSVEEELSEAKEKIQYLEQSQKEILSKGILQTNVQNNIQEEYKQFEDQLQRRKEEKQRKAEEYRKKQEEERKQKLAQLEKLKELQKQRKEERMLKGQVLRKFMLDSHGVMEICFLVDATGSMDHYKEQTMKCIKDTQNAIKNQVNRQVRWSSVAYQDFEEYKDLGEQYLMHQFTENYNQVYEFLERIDCDGGGDKAEDIRGGMKQMIKKLKWEKKFRMCLLITDSPNHGEKWNGGALDEYPEEDMQDALDLMIENKILFLAPLFPDCYAATIMMENIRKYYQEKGASELFHSIELGVENLSTSLTKLIAEATVEMTHTKDGSTHSKKQKELKKLKEQQGNSGALEALVKTMKNPLTFDQQTGIETVEVLFEVFKITLNEDRFEENITNIFAINLEKDFQQKSEGEWKCIRTKLPFAFGMMKEVYLMKKFKSEEVYVVKMPIGGEPFSSITEAIADCRSHLISQRLMNKFINELKQAKEEKASDLPIIDFRYTDFLLLKEKGLNKYWIAERFFSGEFVKYNNNYGYIRDSTKTEDRICQAFSYYTYFTSEFNYMINDVQGIGVYLTDPALNTKQEDEDQKDQIQFDDTDMGQDGIAMFEVSFDKFYPDAKQYLDLLGIQIKT